MDINKHLLEYGRLNLQLKEVNQKINEIINIYKADEESVQLFDYINCNKDRYWKISIEKWAFNRGETVDDLSYDLLKLIKQKKVIRRKMYYRNRNIIEYGIKLAREADNVN